MRMIASGLSEFFHKSSGFAITLEETNAADKSFVHFNCQRGVCWANASIKANALALPEGFSGIRLWCRYSGIYSSGFAIVITFSLPRLRKQIPFSGKQIFVCRPCLPLHGEPYAKMPEDVIRINVLSSFTITVRLPKASRHSRVWVDLPVPQGAVKRYAFPSRPTVLPWSKTVSRFSSS